MYLRISVFSCLLHTEIRGIFRSGMECGTPENALLCSTLFHRCVAICQSLLRVFRRHTGSQTHGQCVWSFFIKRKVNKMKVGIYRRLNKTINQLPTSIRLPVYRSLGMTVGENSVISPGLEIDDPRRIKIGQGCFLNQNIHLYTGAGDAEITIGSRVWIGMETTIVCPTHNLGGPEQRAGKPVYQPVTIRDGCWIGARVTVLPGVTIREGTVVGAGSVVVRDCLPHSLYAGNPARFVRQLDITEDASQYL